MGNSWGISNIVELWGGPWYAAAAAQSRVVIYQQTVSEWCKGSKLWTEGFLSSLVAACLAPCNLTGLAPRSISRQLLCYCSAASGRALDEHKHFLLLHLAKGRAGTKWGQSGIFLLHMVVLCVAGWYKCGPWQRWTTGSLRGTVHLISALHWQIGKIPRWRLVWSLSLWICGLHWICGLVLSYGCRIRHTYGIGSIAFEEVQGSEQRALHLK